METLGNAKEIWRFRDVLAALGSVTLVKPGCEFETLLPQIWKTQEKSCPIGEGLGTPHTTAPPSHKAQTRNLKNVLVVNAHSGVDKGLRVKSCPERWRAWGRGWPRERTRRPGSRRPLPAPHAASRTGQVREMPRGDSDQQIQKLTAGKLGPRHGQASSNQSRLSVFALGDSHSSFLGFFILTNPFLWLPRPVHFTEQQRPRPTRITIKHPQVSGAKPEWLATGLTGCGPSPHLLAEDTWLVQNGFGLSGNLSRWMFEF